MHGPMMPPNVSMMPPNSNMGYQPGMPGNNSMMGMSNNTMGGMPNSMGGHNSMDPSQQMMSSNTSMPSNTMMPNQQGMMSGGMGHNAGPVGPQRMPGSAGGDTINVQNPFADGPSMGNAGQYPRNSMNMSQGYSSGMPMQSQQQQQPPVNNMAGPPYGYGNNRPGSMGGSYTGPAEMQQQQQQQQQQPSAMYSEGQRMGGGPPGSGEINEGNTAPQGPPMLPGGRVRVLSPHPDQLSTSSRSTPDSQSGSSQPPPPTQYPPQQGTRMGPQQGSLTQQLEQLSPSPQMSQSGSGPERKYAQIHVLKMLN